MLNARAYRIDENNETLHAIEARGKRLGRCDRLMENNTLTGTSGVYFTRKTSNPAPLTGKAQSNPVPVYRKNSI
jgi:hypothetical protein